MAQVWVYLSLEALFLDMGMAAPREGPLFSRPWNPRNGFIRLLREPAPASRVRGATERRTAVYSEVHEDSSTGSTKQSTAGVGFPKKSIVYALCVAPAEVDGQRYQ